MESYRSGLAGEEALAADTEAADQAVHVDDHGTEPGDVRFPRRGDKTPPAIATWRNNLTALSQHRNLYFVGVAQHVHVYQPSGFAQSIGSTPALILTPVMKNPHAPGYISRAVPHAINNIVVGDLGEEEILLLATDSGNVCAYHTERIHSALKECPSSDAQSPEAKGAQVDCFFAEWVGQSAWGLAIHKYARLIAVSSNTTFVTVFAYALVDKLTGADADGEASGDRIGHNPDSEWVSLSGGPQYTMLRSWSPHVRRSRNLRLTLSGHSNNIPNVSFLNSDLDVEGNWLFSTDIENSLLAWRLWYDYRPVNAWGFHDKGAERMRYWSNIHQRGWNVLALDPRIFRPKGSITAACGGIPKRRTDSGGVYDLSSLSLGVPNSSRHYDHFPPEQLPGPNSYPSDIGGPRSDESFSGSFASSCPSSPDVIPTEAVHGEDEDVGPTSNDAESNAGPHAAETAEEAQQTAESEVEEEESDQGPNNLDALLFRLRPPAAVFDTSDLGWAAVTDEESEEEEDEEEEDESESDDHLLLVGESVAAEPYQEAGQEQLSDPSEGDEEDPVVPQVFSQFPILHFSESVIRLIPNPYTREPFVVYRSPLAQSFTQLVESIQACDRFNMVQEIPELGVVVAASQKGRVAIISLTQAKEGMFFRVDSIVPFASQEKFGLRPLCPLLGIAVGPVASHLTPPGESSSSSGEVEEQDGNDKSSDESVKRRSGSLHDSAVRAGEPSEASQPPETSKREAWHGSEYSRRYRLFLMYCDHTVMHYELYYDWPRDIRGAEGRFMYDCQLPFVIRP